MAKKLKCWKEQKDKDGDVFALSPTKSNKSNIAGYSITNIRDGLSVNEFTKDGAFRNKILPENKKGFLQVRKAQLLMNKWAGRHNNC